MAKIVASKQTRADGSKFIAGYKISLQKTKMEECGFKEGDTVEIVYKKGEVRIIHK